MLPQLIAAGIGIWLMFAPLLLDLPPGPSDLLWFLGPIAVSIGLMAASAVLRGVRRANVVMGLALIIGPWLMGAEEVDSLLVALSGLALVLLGLLPSRVAEPFGGGWRSLLGADDQD